MNEQTSYSSLAYPDNEQVLRQNVLQISRNRDLKTEIEKWYHEEMANGFNDDISIDYIDSMYRLIQTFLDINNPRSEAFPNGRMPDKRMKIIERIYNPQTNSYEEKEKEILYPCFDLTPAILRFYTNAKNVSILNKSRNGQAVLNATETRNVRSETQRNYAFMPEKDFFGKEKQSQHEERPKYG